METNNDGKLDLGFKDHIIICNWSDNARMLIKELHAPSLEKHKSIIIISENPDTVPFDEDDDRFQGVMLVKGNPSHVITLKRACLLSAETIIILADDTLGEAADTKTIMTAIAIDHLSTNIHVVAEVKKAENAGYFDYTSVDEVVCLEEYTEKLLAQSCLTPGSTQIFEDLLTQSSDTNEIYVEEVPKHFIGKKYQELRTAFINNQKQDLILIGISTLEDKKNEDGTPQLGAHGEHVKKEKLYINPKSEENSGKYLSKEHILKKTDKVYIIAYLKPDLNRI